MNTPVFLVMRYSVLLSENKGWRIGRKNSFENYKSELFSKERMDVHFNLFSQYVIPCIERQEGGLREVRLLILTSSDLPECEKKRLYELVSGKKWIYVIEMSANENINNVIKNNIQKTLIGNESLLTKLLTSKKLDATKYYATVRLDDDDLLCKNYVESLKKYISKDFSGYTVSFPKGYISRVSLPEFKLSSTISVDIPKTALGLAHISSYNIISKSWKSKYTSIYDVGNHVKVDERTPYISDYSLCAYIRTSYEEQDTENYSFQKFSESSACVDSKKILKKFGLKHANFTNEHDKTLKKGGNNNE